MDARGQKESGSINWPQPNQEPHPRVPQSYRDLSGTYMESRKRRKTWLNWIYPDPLMFVSQGQMQA